MLGWALADAAFLLKINCLSFKLACPVHSRHPFGKVGMPDTEIHAFEGGILAGGPFCIMGTRLDIASSHSRGTQPAALLEQTQYQAPDTHSKESWYLQPMPGSACPSSNGQAPLPDHAWDIILEFTLYYFDHSSPLNT